MSLTSLERRDIRIFKEEKEEIVSSGKIIKKVVPKTKKQELSEYLKKHDLE